MVDKTREIVNLKTIIICLSVLCIGIFLILITFMGDWQNFEILQLFLRELGGLLIVSLSISLIWEIWIKRTFLDEILEKLKLSKDIDDSGIIRIYNYFLDININEWKEFFKTTKEIDLFFCYARTWRRNLTEVFKELKPQKNLKIRIILPNPENNDVIQILCSRFNYEKEELKKLIKEAINQFKELVEKSDISLDLRFIEIAPLFSLYKFDEKLIFCLFTHRNDVSVPAFMVKKGGSLFNYFSEEFNFLYSKSIQYSS